VRLVIARCSVDYVGRLTAHLPLATRLLMVKADGSVLVHADGGSYKPLNWMSPPCTLTVQPPSAPEAADGVTAVWTVQQARSDDRLHVRLHEVLHDTSHELGPDPGLVKDGVEAHLQALLAEHIETLGPGVLAGAPRVHDGDRAGRHPVPRRLWARAWRSRSSAAATSTVSSSSPATSS
jgi:RecB family endonuclease NucS